jgi:hypothetical protein
MQLPGLFPHSQIEHLYQVCILYTIQGSGHSRRSFVTAATPTSFYPTVSIHSFSYCKIILWSANFTSVCRNRLRQTSCLDASIGRHLKQSVFRDLVFVPVDNGSVYGNKLYHTEGSSQQPRHKSHQRNFWKVQM